MQQALRMRVVDICRVSNPQVLLLGRHELQLVLVAASLASLLVLYTLRLHRSAFIVEEKNPSPSCPTQRDTGS